MPEYSEGSAITTGLDEKQDRVPMSQRMEEVAQRLDGITALTPTHKDSSSLDAHAIHQAAQALHDSATAQRVRQNIRSEVEFGKVSGLFDGITSVRRTDPIQGKSDLPLPTAARADIEHVTAMEKYVTESDNTPLDKIQSLDPTAKVTGGENMRLARESLGFDKPQLEQPQVSYLSDRPSEHTSEFEPRVKDMQDAAEMVAQYAPGPISRKFFDTSEKSIGTQLQRKMGILENVRDWVGTRITGAKRFFKDVTSPHKMPPPKAA